MPTQINTCWMYWNCVYNTMVIPEKRDSLIFFFHAVASLLQQRFSQFRGFQYWFKKVIALDKIYKPTPPSSKPCRPYRLKIALLQRAIASLWCTDVTMLPDLEGTSWRVFWVYIVKVALCTFFWVTTACFVYEFWTFTLKFNFYAEMCLETWNVDRSPDSAEAEMREEK